jgi:cellulose synthase/poly-beta-1,6-N-acetylglucosamine synthase-like glycosyltransferase
MIGEYHLILTVMAQNLFHGLHRFDSFDLVILNSYLIVFAILSVYGLHKGWLVYTYLRWRHNVPTVPPDPAEWPTVTVQLPIYNERYVVERLLDAVARLDYPRELLDIQLLDDSTDETREVALACVQQWQARGLPIRYMHRGHRTGFKAGNLAEGLKSATGEFVAHFDADFVPTRDFLRRTVPYFFEDPKIAVVQARWTFLNGSYSVVTEVQSLMQNGHFTIEQGARSRSGAFFNFNGTAGIWRRSAVIDAGGWEHETLTEDTDLSYRAQLRGWRFLYLPYIECPSELPVELNAFKVQQERWSKGLIQTAKKLLPRILLSDAPVRAKVEAFFHLTGAISAPLMVVFAMLLLPASIVRAHEVRFQSIWIDLPGILSSVAVVAFYVVSQRSLYPRAWKRSMLYLPLLIALGIGLSLSNAKAVLEALFGIKSDFVRTPKYNMNGKSGGWQGKQYRSPAGWVPYLEIAFGLYYVFVFIYVLRTGNYRMAPFMLLFILGFLYMGVMSLAQRWWGQLRQGAQRAPSSEAQPVAPDEVFPPQLSEADRLPYLDSASAVEGGGESPRV